MDLTAARAFFPGTREVTFLDAACVSLMPIQAQTALEKLGHDLVRCVDLDASAHHIALDRTADQPRVEAARLIGARPDEIALIESTTQGLEAIAASLKLHRGEKILVGATEFMGLAVPWIGRQQLDGFHIQVIPHRQGRLLVDDFAAAIDAKTRMILLSSVQWNNGFRADLAQFSALARERGVILVVDAIQQLGAISVDVEKTPVDFLVCGGHKWLNAPVGRGLLYVNPRCAERVAIPAWGYLNIQEPAQGWADYFATPGIPAVREYEFTPSARRFEIGGTANYPGNVALGASLKLLNEFGMQPIESHILSLTGQLIEHLGSAGATVVSPTGDGERSSIVTFTLGEGPSRDKLFLQRILKERILISQRYTAGVGGLRVSVHLFNHAADLDRLLEEIRAEFRRVSTFTSS